MMRRWWKKLAAFAGGILCFGGFLSSAYAQGPLSGFFQKGPEDHKAKNAPEDFSLPDRGEPNAFTTLLDTRVRYPGPLISTSFRNTWAALRPGIFAPTLTPAVPAEFPNAAVPSNDPASPWTVREEGMGNAFNELADPRPRPFMECLHGQRRLITELLDPCPQVVPPWTVSFRSDFLYWRPTPGPSGAELVTTTNNPNAANVGQLGNPNTIVLVGRGENTFGYGYMPGFRFGMTVSPTILPPIDVSGFTMSQQITPFSGGSLTTNRPLLAVPFQDIQPAQIIPGSNGVGRETSLTRALPTGFPGGGQGGVISVDSGMDFWNIEAAVFIPIGISDVLKLDVILGYQHLQMNELIELRTTTGGAVGNAVFQGVTLPQGLFQTSTLDSFRTINAFDGGVIGARATLTANRVSAIIDGRLGIGVSNSKLNVNGSSTLTFLQDPSQSTTVNGGILAHRTNETPQSFTTVRTTSEISGTLAYQVSANLRAYVGYSFLYWSAVARPGDFISHQVDARQIPTGPNFTPNVGYTGPNLPGGFSSRNFFATGLFLGVEIGF